MRVPNSLPVLLVVVAGACVDATSPPVQARLAPIVAPAMDLRTRLVDDEYIVVLRDDADEVLGAARARGRGGQVVAQWRDALRGFAVRGGPALILALRGDPDVLYLEQVQEYSIDATQTNATWGLDRIDQASLPLSGTYTYGKTGSGVRAYIIDTGIRTSHGEFGGRATDGYDAVDGSLPAADCNGHGTHVAGTVGGTTWGVAKSVTLVAVRVLDCGGSGTTTGVISGVNWVAANAVKPAVANMSLGGGASSTLDNAVSSAIASGVTFVVAAGNSNRNACFYSPARVATAITVGATTSTDNRASYSNYGSCLDIFAPGSSITSAWYTSNTAAAVLSGTSMASPHVAGAAALYLEGRPASTSAATVAAAITGTAVTGKVKKAGNGSPNRLLQTSGL